MKLSNKIGEMTGTYLKFHANRNKMIENILLSFERLKRKVTSRSIRLANKGPKMITIQVKAYDHDFKSFNIFLTSMPQYFPRIGEVLVLHGKPLRIQDISHKYEGNRQEITILAKVIS